MVNFNNETTIGTPAVDVIRILILQRRADLFEAWENHKKKVYQGSRGSIYIVRARLLSLFMEIQPALEHRHLKREEYLSLLAKVKSNKEEDIEEAMFILNDFLDKIKLIRLDTKIQYNKTRVEIENRFKGL